MARFTDDYDGTYARGRLPMRVYVSGPWTYNQTGDDPDGLVGRLARFSYEVFDSQERSCFASPNGIEVVLRETPTRQQIKAVFFEDDRSVPRLIFQRFGPAGSPYKDEMSFTGSEVTLLREFLDVLETIPIEEEERQRFSEAAIRQAVGEADTRRLLYDDNRDLLIELIEQDIGARDVVAIAHRKRVLSEFQRMLNDDPYFDEQASKAGGEEAAWQAFFEESPWLLGMNLSLRFLHSWNPDSLESVVQGHSIAGSGKRADALLATAGLMRSLCLVEIKTHRTDLMRRRPYRPEVWSASKDLSGGIAYCHAVAEETRDNVGAVLPELDADGATTGEGALVSRPKTVLVVGSLGDFRTEGGANHKKFRAFENLRRTTSDPEVVTYDELFERARLSLELLYKSSE